ncbi:MAG: glycosyltransferase family 2 protein, partial [Candidatus Delongbacteria bacterium]|nr:glycosyltransferase family 2 protein [Candidatus Delongbacteria bacterium]
MEHSITPSLISIIIPVFNAERTLPQCLDGLFHSSDQDFEVILVDDASSDRSLDIARDYPIRCFQLPVNQGANHARNYGARYARGSILLFIDADIVIRPGIPARIREKMADSSISAVVGVYSGDESDQGLVTRYKNHWIRFSYCLYQVPIDWIFGSITAMRKETFDRTH